MWKSIQQRKIVSGVLKAQTRWPPCRGFVSCGCRLGQGPWSQTFDVHARRGSHLGNRAGRWFVCGGNQAFLVKTYYGDRITVSIYCWFLNMFLFFHYACSDVPKTRNHQPNSQFNSRSKSWSWQHVRSRCGAQDRFTNTINLASGFLTSCKTALMSGQHCMISRSVKYLLTGTTHYQLNIL